MIYLHERIPVSRKQFILVLARTEKMCLIPLQKATLNPCRYYQLIYVVNSFSIRWRVGI